MEEWRAWTRRRAARPRIKSAASRSGRWWTATVSTDGKKFRLKDYDPGGTADHLMARQTWSERCSRAAPKLLAELQDKLYAQDRWAVLLSLPGDGRRRQGRHDQARHVGRQPAGLPGRTRSRRPRPRSSITTSCGARASAAGARPHRHLQPLATTRRCWSVRVHPEFLAAQKLPPTLVDEAHLEASATRTSRLRAPPRAQRHRRSSSSSSTCRRRSRRSASSSGSTTRRRTGSSRAPTSREREYWDDYMEAYEDVIRAHRDAARALVRRPRRPQVVHAAGRRRGDHRRAERAQSRLPEGHRRAARRPRRRARQAGGGT